MKRNLELIRALLAETEDSKDFLHWHTSAVAGYSEAEVCYHIMLIKEAGLAEAWISDELGVETPEAHLVRLTWEGHNFLDASRDNTRWEKAKSIFEKIGGASFEVVLKTLTEMATKQAFSLIG